MLPQKYYTPTEAAELLRSSRSTLAKLRLTGSGPAFFRIGRAVRYGQSDLDRWMKGSKSFISHPATRAVK
jgi:excisionase family DNA binding protein